MDPSCEANVDKKRKAISPEPELESNQHSSSTTLSHLALIPNFKELVASQAKTISHEVCIYRWTITYKEFQP